MPVDLVEWVHRCSACAFLASTLAVDTEGIARGAEAIDEDHRQRALDAVRLENFETVLEGLKRHLPRGRLLEVGSAHGWFLRASLDRGFDAYGLEPDAGVHARIEPALRERTALGYFPGDLRDDRRFDAIVFNDVFEHVPDVEAVLRACYERLSPGGMLVLNLPYSNGFFYRAAETAARVGVVGPYERMWQRQFPSPHLSYFTPSNLERLCAKHGFIERERLPLRALRFRGLWSRVAYDRTLPRPVAAALWLAVASVVPLQPLVPPDAGVQFFQRT